ncbi:MAG: hypothetical protein IJQ20_07515 [Paludibacteraceae bacterium]|nr:hypothetical protein [Paludibacteraceae bacterium]MBQ9602836.1 hypothetical protein [Paludibacteraceae bacterium]
MKNRTIVLALLAFCSISLFAQLNISAQGGKSDVLYKDSWCNVKFDGKRYEINCKDIRSAVFFPLVLGETKEQAILSLQQIQEWLQNAKNKDFITIEQEEETVTLYKYAKDQMIMSYGDEDYCRETYKQLNMGAFASPAFVQRRTNDPYFGYIQGKSINKAIEKLKAFGGN